MYYVTGKLGTSYVKIKRPTSEEANKAAQALRDNGYKVTIELLTARGKKVT